MCQELENQDMNIENIVVNQLISLEMQDYDGMIKEVQSSSLSQNVKDVTLKSLFRCKMQQKYLEQIDELYEDKNVIKIEIQKDEIRGLEWLKT